MLEGPGDYARELAAPDRRVALGLDPRLRDTGPRAIDRPAPSSRCSPRPSSAGTSLTELRGAQLRASGAPRAPRARRRRPPCSTTTRAGPRSTSRAHSHSIVDPVARPLGEGPRGRRHAAERLATQRAVALAHVAPPHQTATPPPRVDARDPARLPTSNARPPYLAVEQLLGSAASPERRERRHRRPRRRPTPAAR